MSLTILYNNFESILEIPIFGNWSNTSLWSRVYAKEQRQLHNSAKFWNVTKIRLPLKGNLTLVESKMNLVERLVTTEWFSRISVWSPCWYFCQIGLNYNSNSPRKVFKTTKITCLSRVGFHIFFVAAANFHKRFWLKYHDLPHLDKRQHKYFLFLKNCCINIETELWYLEILLF